MAAPAYAQDHLMHGASGLPHGIPNFCQDVTITAAASGTWSNPSTWTPARVPTAGDRVAIPTGVTVTYDAVSNAAIFCIGVDGALRFRTDANTQLKVGTLLVRPSGRLEIGREDAPVSAAVTARLVIADQPLDTTIDPEQFGTGLIGLGVIRIHGTPKTTYTRLATEPVAGQAFLTLSTVVSGWKAGDRLVIPDTRQLTMTALHSADFVGQWEEPRLASVSGSSVALSAPLAYAHSGARNLDGKLEFLPHVGNLTRNVIIQSENPAGTRGHAIFAGRADVDIRYAQFDAMGRTRSEPLDSTTWNSSGVLTHIGTNQIGRYVIHMHHVFGPATPPASGSQFVVLGNAITNPLKWGITLHNSHYGLVKGNVVYNGTSAGVVTEDGNESFNVIEQNFVVRMLGQGGRRAFGREGAGFWFHGTNNYVRDNISANIRGTGTEVDGLGFVYYVQSLPAKIRIPVAPGADPTVDGQYTLATSYEIPIREFARNEVYGVTEGGMSYWWIGVNFETIYPNIPQSVIKDLRVWHQGQTAVVHYPSANVVVDGLVVRGKPSIQSTTGIAMSDYIAYNLAIRRADIQGVYIGVSVGTRQEGGFQNIEDSYLRNHINIGFDTLWDCCVEERLTYPRKVVISNVRFAQVGSSGSPAQNIYMHFRSGKGNLILPDGAWVYNYNGQIGDNFRVLFKEQSPTFLVPQTVFDATTLKLKLQGAPVGGLTNTQTWNLYRLAVAGSITPCTVTRPNITGYVCSITAP